jgi:hypothetical protein
MIRLGAIGPLFSTVASLVFLVIGAVALYSMMARMGKKDVSRPEVYTKIHRIAGWSFTTLFAGIFIYMIIRLTYHTDEFPARIASHLTLAITLLCLLAMKISVPRFFPNLGKNLFSLGVGAYLLAFTMVLLTAGYHIQKIITHEPYVYHGDFDKRFADETLGKEFLITKCSACHVLENILKPRSEKAWGHIVNRMVALAQPRISPGEASQILAYLGKNYIPKPIESPASASLIEKHCLPCHSEKDIYKTPYSLIAWKVIIKKMSEFDENIVPPGKVNELAEYLMKNQEK